MTKGEAAGKSQGVIRNDDVFSDLTGTGVFRSAAGDAQKHRVLDSECLQGEMGVIGRMLDEFAIGPEYEQRRDARHFLFECLKEVFERHSL